MRQRRGRTPTGPKPNGRCCTARSATAPPAAASIAPRWKRTSGEAGRTANDRPRPATAVLFSKRGDALVAVRPDTGVTDIPLTVNGETQARAIRPGALELSFSHVLTSARLRAYTTCELAGLGGRAQVEPDLAEWNYGDYEGRRSIDIWFGSNARVGTSFETAARTENRHRRSADVSTAGSRVYGPWTATSRCSRMDQSGAVFGARSIALPVCEAQHFVGRPRVDERVELGPRSPRNSRPRPLERRPRARFAGGSRPLTPSLVVARGRDGSG